MTNSSGTRPMGDLKVPIEYRMILRGNDAYCLKDDMVYTFNGRSIEEVNKADLQTYIYSNQELGYYYFDDTDKKLPYLLNAAIDDDQG